MLKTPNRKLYAAIVIACIAGAAIDHSFFYPVEQNQKIANTQKQTSNESIEASSDQSIATYTKVLALFTIVLAGVGVAQGVFTAQQIRLAQNEFNATHRPKITTRFFRPNITGDGEEFVLRMNVFFEIVNEGDAPATVTEIGTNLIEWHGPWNFGAREIRFDVKRSSSVLASGQRERIFTTATTPRNIMLAEGKASTRNFWWCVGYIRYTDANNIPRETGFCRRWNFDTQSWERQTHEDWEYSY